MSDDEWDDDDEMWEEELELVPFSRQISYEIIEEKEIVRRQAQAIEKIAEEIGLDIATAAVLLIQNSWNPQQVLEKILNGAIDLPFLQRQSSKTLDYSLTADCMMCYKSKKGSDMISPMCDHAFCITCYTEFLKEAVSAGRDCMFTKCPMPDCPVIIPEELFQRLLPKKLFERYKMFVLRSYVDTNSDLKWCPSPDCKCAVKYPKKSAREILCDCGYSWCFGCGRESHRPLTCELFTKWNQKLNADDSEQWLLANTKTCPSCGNAIQKNLGCMHMTCKCGHQFCWLCLEDWTKHGDATGGYYRCNKFTLERGKGKYAADEKNRLMAAYSLKRYEHYFNRFINHKASLKAAKAKKEQAHEKVKHMYELIKESSLFDFYSEAADLVYNVKQSLAYSYAQGYFLTSACKIQFYEFIQGSLESSMIQLDERTNEDILAYVDYEDENCRLNLLFVEYRMNVINLTGIVKNFFNDCMKQMEAGFPEVVSAVEENESEGCSGQTTDVNFTDKWICGACTLANDLNTNSCVACGTQRVL